MSAIGNLLCKPVMKGLLKLAISIGLLVVAIRVLNAQQMFSMLHHGSAAVFVPAIAINGLAFVIMGLRWHRLTLLKLDYSFRYQIALYFKAIFLNIFTPANLGGDVYRLMVLKGGAVATEELVKLLIRERILGLYGYVIVFVSAYATIVIFSDGGVVSAKNPYIYGLAVAATVLALPFVARPLCEYIGSAARALLGPTRFPGLEAWMDTLPTLLSRRGALWLMLLTFIGILLWLMSIKVVANGFGLVVPVLHLAVVATLVELIRLVPITIQGVGLREGAFAYLLSFFGHNPEQCYVVGWASYLTLSASMVLCGPVSQMLMFRGATKEKI